MSVFALQTSIEDQHILQRVMNMSDHSSYRKMLRVAALTQRFLQNCKIVLTGTLNDMRSAVRLLLQYAKPLNTMTKQRV